MLFSVQEVNYCVFFVFYLECLGLVDQPFQITKRHSNPKECKKPLVGRVTNCKSTKEE